MGALWCYSACSATAGQLGRRQAGAARAAPAGALSVQEGRTQCCAPGSHSRPQRPAVVQLTSGGMPRRFISSKKKSASPSLRLFMHENRPAAQAAGGGGRWLTGRQQRMRLEQQQARAEQQGAASQAKGRTLPPPPPRQGGGGGAGVGAHTQGQRAPAGPGSRGRGAAVALSLPAGAAGSQPRGLPPAQPAHARSTQSAAPTCGPLASSRSSSSSCPLSSACWSAVAARCASHAARASLN